jgi:hypothetical protein
VPSIASLDFVGLLETLVRHKVDFIVVGGVSAGLRGAPLITMDLDIVHCREADNVERLLGALSDLGAHYRGRSADFKPDVSHLSSPGHQLLQTRFGSLDILGMIGDGHDYDALLPHSAVMWITEALEVRVLSLAMLIQTKTEVGGEKDVAQLALLRATLKGQGG